MGSLVEVPTGADSGVTLLATSAFRERARELGQRVAAARRFFADIFGVEFGVRALVLDEADWREYCPFPDYGMPFNEAPQTLYAAAADNQLWRTAMPDPTRLPPPVAARLMEVYREQDGFSARRFFDLLVVHELAHLFAHHGELRFGRRWLGELFCNLALHSYVEALEPNQKPALEALPEVVASMPIDMLAHHTLRDWEDLFERVGPLEFAWYQCRLHRAAADIYAIDGAGSIQAMWAFFADRGPALEAVSDAELPDLLAQLSPEVAAVATTWPGNN